MTRQDNARRLEQIANQFIFAADDLKRSQCPFCDHTGSLSVAEEAGHVRFRCSTPIPTTEDGESVCRYELIVYRTDVKDLPTPVFAEKKPVIRKKRRSPQ
jgi:hypothetical protein